MNSVLETKILEKFPELFSGKTAFGFEHSDGWYDIIECLCTNIQNHINWRNRTYKLNLNYNQMREDMLNGIYDGFEEYAKNYGPTEKEKVKERILVDPPRYLGEPVEQVTVEQVKEKFGALRFYYTGGDHEISGMVTMTETLSGRICEVCGCPGKTRSPGWLRTLCDKHANP